VKGCTLDDGSAQLNRFKIGYRGDGACTSNLIVDRQEFCKRLLGLEFICDCPSWELSCVTKFLLVWEFVDFDYDSICRKWKVFAFGIPIGDELFNLINCFA
jgi:hypothetical protein